MARNHRKQNAARQVNRPGSAPGIEFFPGVDQPPPAGAVRAQCYDYGCDRVVVRRDEDWEKVIATPRPEGTTTRWVNIEGLHPYVVDRLRRAYAFHTLAAEDVLRTTQRPKMEVYANHLFIITKMLRWMDGQMAQEQVSFFLFEHTIITFQETPGDDWDPIRKRLEKSDSRLRTLSTAYLLYALLDALVDHVFPILEHYGDELEDLETTVVATPQPPVLQRIHVVKRELAGLRRVLWPMREVLNALQRDESALIPAEVRTYLRDVYDHTLQLMEIVESSREQASGLNDLYMSAMSNRMNEIMKVLTIMASLFIPITFFAGVYGMNFENMPELKWQYSYPVFWAVCILVVIVLLLFFRRRGWIGRK